MKRKVSADFKPVLAIGLMSGTSLDGVDAVLLETDGEGKIALKASAYVAYPVAVRERAKAAAKGDVPLDEVLRLERDLSKLYVQAIKALGKEKGVDLAKVAVVGCHGQTIRHLPDEGLTWQLGDPNYLAAEVGIPVVMDFRRRDMALGGQGAPLVPLYHQAVVGEGKICGVLNLGGVSNLTWFDDEGGIRASDCGPGVGLIDAWMEHMTGKPYDEDGMLGLKGEAHSLLLKSAWDKVPFFKKSFPRSAHRHEFDVVLDIMKADGKLSVEDGLASLCALTANAVHGCWLSMILPSGPIYVVGGGARNKALMAMLADIMKDEGCDVVPGESAGLRGQTMEAEAFAWLAVRRLRNLPFSVPATTGCKKESVGGTLTA